MAESTQQLAERPQQAEGARSGEDAQTVQQPQLVEDPREHIEIGVLMPNGKLAPRTFATLEQARAWAHEDEGEQVVEFNPLCDCEM